MTLNGVVSVVGLLLVVLAAAGAAFAYLVAARGRAVIELQKGTIEAQASRLTEYQLQQVDDHQEIELLKSRVRLLEEEKEVLTNMVTARDLISALTKSVNDRNAKNDEILARLTRGQGQILRLLDPTKKRRAIDERDTEGDLDEHP